jgi:threonine/homoserine/homoserine lactone efflux protein
MGLQVATCWALASLAFVSSITPGPNNFMLMASGMRFGLPRTLPHLFGVTAGFALLLLFADLTLGVAAAHIANLAPVLAAGCAAYLVWLAVKLLRAPLPSAAQQQKADAAEQQPMSVTAAMLFQWVNPKAWSMVIAGATMAQQFQLSTAPRATLLVLIFSAINLPCVLVWAAAGSQMRRLLTQPAFARVFNVTMAAALVATAAWMLLPAG